MSTGVAARAKNDPLLLGVALAIQPALLVLQTLLSVLAHSASPTAFALGFFAADVAVLIALVLLARSERDRSTAIGTGVLVAFIALSSLLTVVGQWSPKLAAVQSLLSSAAGAVSFVFALAVFAVIASIARAAETPFRILATLGFAILTSFAIVMKVLHVTSDDGRSTTGAWFGLGLEVVRSALPIALALATSRLIRARTMKAAASGSPYRSAAIVEDPPPPVELDAPLVPAWRDTLRGLRAIQLALFVRVGCGVLFVLVFGPLVKGSAAAAMPGAPALLIPTSSLVGAIVTMLGYLRARSIGSVGAAKAGWLVAQMLWAFVVLVDVVTVMFGLNVVLETKGEKLATTLAFVALPGAMTLLLELGAAMWTARALRHVGEGFREPFVARRAGTVLAVGLVAVGAFFATLGASWVGLDIDGHGLVAPFVLAMTVVSLVLVGSTLGLLGRLLGTVRETIARTIASAG